MIQYETDVIVDNAVQELFTRAASVNLARRDVGNLLGVSAQAVHNWATGRHRTDSASTFLRILQLNSRLSTMPEEERVMIRDNIKKRKRWVSAMAGT